MSDPASTEGVVVSLQLCPGYRKPMQGVRQAEAIANLGFKNDIHALPDSSRQILLIEQETLRELHLIAGAIKENITTQGMNLMRLQHGDQLMIGTAAILEITKACSPCSRMDEIRPGLKQLLAGRRGMLTRVIEGGTVRVGDTIRLRQR